jgi:hypothetical protein
MSFANRQQYRASHQTGIENIEHLVFNKWKIVQTKIPVGHVLTTIAKTTIPREKAPNLTFYVKGSGSITNSNGLLIPNRSAGDFSGYKPDHPQGITNLTAIEDIEFWCCNRTQNRGKLPILTPVIISKDSTINIVPRDLYLVCYGELEGKRSPYTIIGTTVKTFVATETTYLLNFQE